MQVKWLKWEVMWHQNDSDSHDAVMGRVQEHVAQPQKELNIIISIWPCLAYSIWKQKCGMDPTMDNQQVRVRETGPHQTCWPCCVHVVDFLFIIQMQRHGNCNQYATRYGNAIKESIGAVFEQVPIAHRKHAQFFSLQEEGCKDRRTVATQNMMNV